MIRILLVDDEPMILDVGSQMLEVLGYHVQVESSGGNCLSALLREPYDLLILDYNLDDMNAQQIVEKIIEYQLPVCIIISSGTPNQSLGDTQLDKRISGFLNKPFKIEELEQIVLQVVKKR